MTSWTLDYTDATLTVAWLKALHEEWLRNQPVPVLFAAWLGVKPREYGTAEDLVERLKANSPTRAGTTAF